MTLPLADHQKTCSCFATLLRYPQAGLTEVLTTCTALLEGQGVAARTLDPFCRVLEEEGVGRLEELYTAAFDLQPQCYPYVGYQLFGEGKQRPLFLIKLQECYRQQGYLGGGELPDHVSEVLRFLATAATERVRNEVIEDALLPALRNMTPPEPDALGPYGRVLQALQEFLAAQMTISTAGHGPGLKQEVR